MTSENQLRLQVKVIDGITNITLPIIKFVPLLSSPPVVQQSLTRLRVLVDAEVSAKAASELKAKQEAEAKAASELKAKQEAEAKAATVMITKQNSGAAAIKKTLITCVKGKLTRKVNAVKPVCPVGYRKK